MPVNITCGEPKRKGIREKIGPPKLACILIACNSYTFLANVVNLKILF